MARFPGLGSRRGSFGSPAALPRGRSDGSPPLDESSDDERRASHRPEGLPDLSGRQLVSGTDLAVGAAHAAGTATKIRSLSAPPPTIRRASTPGVSPFGPPEPSGDIVFRLRGFHHRGGFLRASEPGVLQPGAGLRFAAFPPVVHLRVDREVGLRVQVPRGFPATLCTPRRTRGPPLSPRTAPAQAIARRVPGVLRSSGTRESYEPAHRAHRISAAAAPLPFLRLRGFVPVRGPSGARRRCQRHAPACPSMGLFPSEACALPAER